MPWQNGGSGCASAATATRARAMQTARSMAAKGRGGGEEGEGEGDAEENGGEGLWRVSDGLSSEFGKARVLAASGARGARRKRKNMRVRNKSWRDVLRCW